MEIQLSSCFLACVGLGRSYSSRWVGEAAISGASESVVGHPDSFARAWQALRADPAVQFNLPPPAPPAKPPQWLLSVLDLLGSWLKPVGRFMKWLVGFLPEAEYARILLWGAIGVGAAVILWAFYNRLKHGKWTLRRRRASGIPIPNEEEEWTPEEAGVRSWLEEADALARNGQFADAIHHLLLRSVEDISRRRPNLVRPAITSRELAASRVVPERARKLFAGIAQMVERSWFGGRPVVETDWVAAREAYSNFAIPAAWRA